MKELYIEVINKNSIYILMVHYNLMSILKKTLQLYCNVTHKASHIRWSDFVCLIPTGVFIIITSKYWGQTPALDAMYYYRQSVELYSFGLSYLLHINTAIHPPLFMYLIGIFFHFFGTSPQTYNLLGIVLFICSSIYLYFYLKTIFGRWFAAICTMLLFINPNIISNFLYPNPETLLLSLIILALGAYTFEKNILLSIICALFYLTKETGLIFATGFIALYCYKTISRMHLPSKKTILLRCIAIALPLALVFTVWTLASSGFNDQWKSSYLFEETHESSYILFAIKRLITLHFINGYLIQNIFNIFAFNFQWVFSLSLLMLWLYYGKKNKIVVKSQQQLIIILISTSVIYLFSALSFPTWTIPRYGLVLLVSLFFFLTMFIQKIRIKLLRTFLVAVLVGVSFVANTQSIDPLSRLLGTSVVANQELYNISVNTNGDDALTYNLQYVKPVSEQNFLIYQAVNNSADILVINCNEFKLWERIYSLNQYPFAYPQFPYSKPLDCLSRDEAAEKFYNGELTGKSIYMQVENGEWNTYSF